MVAPGPVSVAKLLVDAATVLSLDRVSTAVCIFDATAVACFARSASAQPRNSSGEGKPERVLYVNVLCLRNAPSMIMTNRFPDEATSSGRSRACRAMVDEFCWTVSSSIKAQGSPLSRVTQPRFKSRAREASPNAWIPRCANARRTTTSQRSISKSHGTKSSGWEKMIAHHSHSHVRSDGEVNARSALPNPLCNCDTNVATLNPPWTGTRRSRAPAAWTKHAAFVVKKSVERGLCLRNSAAYLAWAMVDAVSNPETRPKDAIGQRIDVGNTDMVINGSRKDSRTKRPALTLHSGSRRDAAELGGECRMPAVARCVGQR